MLPVAERVTIVMMMQFGRNKLAECGSGKALCPIQNVFGDLPEVTTERV